MNSDAYPPDDLRKLVEERRAEGWSEERIAEFERHTFPEGDAIIVERDPFAELPLTEGES